MADASSVPDTPRTNGSIDTDLQRFGNQFNQQENHPANAWNGSSVEEGEDTLVLAFLVRLDLQMSTGAAAKYCCTACLGQFKKLYKIKSVDLRQWELTNGKKVCLGVSNEEAMLDIQAVARKKGIPTRTVMDERSAKTVLALGPARATDLNPLLLHLKEI
ncbi:hypothetical protein WJX75_000922 [Coccomyxa subellipsoidea]|uniref:peptidyl-tRNA hydrolase n=1 Tax=Coccomyxa subellipsoidea TaxID=248742 RepID=A0ABR2YDY0_9CHLO